MRQVRKGRSLQPLELNISNGSGYIPHAPAPPKRGYSPDLESSSRLEQLEAENVQLKKLLEAAELSIAGYKRFLSARNSLNYHSVSIQTDAIVSEYEHQESIDSDLQGQNECLVSEISHLRKALSESNDQHLKLKDEYDLRLHKLTQKFTLKRPSRPLLNQWNHLNTTTLITSDLNQFQSFFCHSFSILLKVISKLPSTSVPDKVQTFDCATATDPIEIIPNENNFQQILPMQSPTSSSSTNPVVNLLSSTSQTECDSGNQMARISESPEILSLTQKLKDISLASEQLVVKFGSEINAIKHLSHCKDLVRVAALRELNLEKDRLVNDLKYSRDVQGLLWFCLETSEKMLRDMNPQIVLRLQESRQKRMLILERDVSEKRKDIEQRSMETCTVSVNHLETFQLKAEMRCKIAATESHDSLFDLQKLLR